MTDEAIRTYTRDLAPFVLDALLQTSADAIVATDREGRVRVWNPGAARIFGFEAREAVGRSLDLIIPENLRALHWQGYDRVMETGRSRYGAGELLSVPALTKDGRRISVEFTITILHNDRDVLIGMVAVMRDVTGRFQEMKALRKKLAVFEVAGPAV